jgi:Mrp family chromosome partitioning ATPase
MIILQAHGRRAPERINVGHKTRFMPNGAFQPGEPMTPQQALMSDALPPHTPSPLSADADATVTGTDIICLADLEPQPVEWLWQHRLAAGTLAMLSGKPGSGKTWVALAIAAALTRGRDPFSGETLKPVTVLYASAEHSPSQVSKMAK